MANAFVSYKSNGITTETTVFTGPADTQTTIIGLTVANTGASTATASVKLGSAYLVKNVEIPLGSSVVVVGGNQKVVAMAGDTVSVESDVLVDVVISTLEIS